MSKQQQLKSWCEWCDEVSLMGGSVQAVSSDAPADHPVILVPDGRGDYRDHQVIERPKGRLGF